MCTPTRTGFARADSGLRINLTGRKGMNPGIYGKTGATTNLTGNTGVNDQLARTRGAVPTNPGFQTTLTHGG